MHGQRLISWPQGDKETSTYKDGFIHGLAVYRYMNGEYEECNYKEGRIDGDCKYYSSDNDLIETCTYNQNALVECKEKNPEIVSKMNKMTERVFGIVKDAAELVTGQ